MYKNDDIDYLSFLREKNIYIFGAGEKGKRLANSLFLRGFCVKAFIDSDPRKIGVRGGMEIVSLDDYKSIKESDENAFIIISSNNYASEIKNVLFKNNIFECIYDDQIDFPYGEQFFNEQYYEWYETIGSFAAINKFRIFQPFVLEGFTIVDFGCGGGHLLSKFEKVNKIGVEVSEIARKECTKRGIPTVKQLSEIDEDVADVVISSSTLNFVEDPLGVIKDVYRITKLGGKAVFHVVGCYGENYDYYKSDINNTCYLWDCLSMGNLFKTAGFFVRSVKEIPEAWPYNYEKLYDQVGYDVFEFMRKVWGEVSKRKSILIVAEKHG